jgi:stearoyl-CoA desaturase (delta-9 desaturase)
MGLIGLLAWEVSSIQREKVKKKESIVVAARRQGLNRFTVLILVLLHMAAISALFMFSWKALAVTVAFYYMTTGLGISMGYHRLHTHRS